MAKHADAIAQMRREVQARLEALEAQLGELRAMREREHDDDEHDPDGVSLSSEWSRLEGLRASVAAELAAIDDAAVRAARGDGGMCVSCGEPIPPARLAVRPHATVCVECGEVTRG